MKKLKYQKATSSEDSDDDDDEEDGDESSNDSEEVEKEEEEGGGGKGLNLDGAKAMSNDLKRVRPRYTMCENCSEEFDVTDNVKGACVYHDGKFF